MGGKRDSADAQPSWDTPTSDGCFDGCLLLQEDVLGTATPMWRTIILLGCLESHSSTVSALRSLLGNILDEGGYIFLS